MWLDSSETRFSARASAKQRRCLDPLDELLAAAIERRLKLPELRAHKDFVQNSPRSPQFLLPDQMVEGHIAVGQPDPVFVYPLLGNHRVQMR